MNWRKLFASIIISLIVVIVGCGIGIGTDYLMKFIIKDSILKLIITILLIMCGLVWFVYSEIKEPDKKQVNNEKEK